MTKESAKIVFNFIFIIICFLIQLSIMPLLKIYNAHPFIMPFVVIIIAVFQGPWIGGSVGFFAGLLCDAMMPPSDMFYTFFFMIASVIVGITVKNIFKKNFLSAFGFSFIATIMMNLLFYLFFFQIAGRADSLMLLYICVPEILITLPFVPFIYLFVRRIYKKSN